MNNVNSSKPMLFLLSNRPIQNLDRTHAVRPKHAFLIDFNRRTAVDVAAAVV